MTYDWMNYMNNDSNKLIPASTTSNLPLVQSSHNVMNTMGDRIEKDVNWLNHPFLKFLMTSKSKDRAMQVMDSLEKQTPEQMTDLMKRISDIHNDALMGDMKHRQEMLQEANKLGFERYKQNHEHTTAIDQIYNNSQQTGITHKEQHVNQVKKNEYDYREGLQIVEHKGQLARKEVHQERQTELLKAENKHELTTYNKKNEMIQNKLDHGLALQRIECKHQQSLTEQHNTKEFERINEENNIILDEVKNKRMYLNSIQNNQIAKLNLQQNNELNMLDLDYQKQLQEKRQVNESQITEKNTRIIADLERFCFQTMATFREHLQKEMSTGIKHYVNQIKDIQYLESVDPVGASQLKQQALQTFLESRNTLQQEYERVLERLRTSINTYEDAIKKPFSFIFSSPGR